MFIQHIGWLKMLHGVSWNMLDLQVSLLIGLNMVEPMATYTLITKVHEGAEGTAPPSCYSNLTQVWSTVRYVSMRQWLWSTVLYDPSFKTDPTSPIPTGLYGMGDVWLAFNFGPTIFTHLILAIFSLTFLLKIFPARITYKVWSKSSCHNLFRGTEVASRYEILP